jgi:hypothetical protein
VSDPILTPEEVARERFKVRHFLTTIESVDRLCDSHEALRLVPPERRWSPIETAPKDGTAVLVFEPARFGCDFYGYCHFERYSDGSEGWIGGSFVSVPKGSWSAFLQPTHWQPLPDPPTVALHVPLPHATEAP